VMNELLLWNHSEHMRDVESNPKKVI
jgi:hypothetical protein